MCPEDPDFLVRHRERRQARIVGRLLTQAAVSVALLLSCGGACTPPGSTRSPRRGPPPRRGFAPCTWGVPHRRGRAWRRPARSGVFRGGPPPPPPAPPPPRPAGGG